MVISRTVIAPSLSVNTMSNERAPSKRAGKWGSREASLRKGTRKGPFLAY